jgi:tetratricopeptide (TPR) repeat protein
VKIGRNRQDNSEFDMQIEKNRINEIETVRIEPVIKEPMSAKQKYTIIALALASVSLIAILLIVNFLYNRPGSPGAGPNTPITGSDVMQGKELLTPFQTENPQLKKAIASYNSGYLANAITEFTDVVESTALPKDKAIALIYLGIIADHKGEYDNAINYFQRAENYDENNPEIYLNLARTYRKKHDYNNAVKYAEKTSDMIPGDVNPLILLGNINYELSNWDEAIKYYEKALKIDSSNPALLYNMALALFKKGERFPALEFLKKAAESDKIGDVAYNSYSRLGAEFLESNMFDLAEKYLVQATHLRPQDPVGRYNLAVAYLRQNKTAEALRELEESERLSQGDMVLLESIGESYFSLKDYDRSLRSYNKVLETSSRNVKILSRIGEIYYSKGDLERAYESYRKVTQIQPATENARIAYLNMGNILDDAQRFEDAIKAYESAIAIRDNDDLAYYNLGIAYKHSDKSAMAINSWRKATQINPDNVKARLAMADYYYEQGYNDQAEKTYQEIVYKWPNHQEALFKLGTIYHKHKDYTDAGKAYSKVIEAGESTDLARKAMINLAIVSSGERNDDESLNRSIKNIQKALLLKPDDSDALLALGIIYARKEMHSKAVDAFYQSIKSSRDNKMTAEAYNNMGKSYYQMKEYKKSLQAFTRGVEEDPSNEEIRINRKTAVQAYEGELEKQR